MNNNKDDKWIGVCPKCKRFHRDHINCDKITKENEKDKKK